MPKIAVSSYLREVAVAHGVRPEQVVHVPLAFRQDKFRLTRPLEGRPPRVAMMYFPAEMKGPEVGLEALRQAKARVPELEAVVFGVLESPPEGLDWVSYRRLPSQDELVHDLYNGSRLFLSSSAREGFGLPGLEAMACGCALVTTDSGGPRDYAIDGVTARVAPVGDTAGLADRVVELVGDEAGRLELAQRGLAKAAEFTWTASAAALEAFLVRYQSSPDAFQQAEDGLDLPGRVWQIPG